MAPTKESTLERKMLKEGEAAKAANPIYDVEHNAAFDPKNLPSESDFIISGFNGAEEDEIMDKVFNEYSVNAIDSYGNKTG